MRLKLTPLLFEDHDRDEAESKRRSLVAKSGVSDAAKAKVSSKRTKDGFPFKVSIP